MSIKQKTITQPPKTVLIKSKEIFNKELLDRIEIGKKLNLREIVNYGDLEQFNIETSSWDDYNKELIKQAFNNQYSEYYRDYSRVNQMIGFGDYMKGVNTTDPQYKLREAKEKVENCLIILRRLVEKLPLIEQDGLIVPYNIPERTFFNCGFIVHGHNNTIKLEVARYVEKELKRKAIILHEEPSKGKTIIEKFENNSNVDFAIALWTADDVGKEKTEIAYSVRARQNVVFETGFFIGALGRENVIVLIEDSVDIPTDYSGVIFIPLTGNWKDDLRKEIEAIYDL